MKNLLNINPAPPRRPQAFSLLELLIVVAAISSVVAMAFVHLNGATRSARETKLEQDVAVINRAVSAYRMSGGDLSAASTGEAVIDKLKTVSTAAQREHIAGLRQSMVDQRLRGIASTDTGTPRAVWNGARSAFEVTSTGTGFKEFILDNAITGAPVEESRRMVLAMNKDDNWIWKYGDSSRTASGPRQETSTPSDPVAASVAPASIPVLLAPGFSKPAGLYNYSEFAPDMKVSLVNPNSAADSDVLYSIANGPWQRYNGTPLSIPRALETQVRAYSAPLDPDKFEESPYNSAQYETIFFEGLSDGLFSNPTGQPALVSNLGGGASSATFTFGSPATSLGFTQPNSLNFAGASFNQIAPEQLFELGTLTYYNGTVWSGTAATSVQLNINLNLTTPAAVQNLPFTFNLLSTINRNVDPDADADYVYIPDVSTQFNTTIKGQLFYLVLSFGDHGSNGFTTINTFHTHENKTMSGKIYGRFTTTPPA